MSVNVNRGLKDEFYRYKMPKIIAKVEGKGNGIKTVITNMVEVAKALNRPPMYPTKFFGTVLGAQTNFDKNERYIVNGSHDSSKLQDILDSFIQKYVLCPSCKNPETDLHVSTKRAQISTTCKACGHFEVLNHRDKLAAYIIKCPPGSDNSQATNGKESKKSKRNKDKKLADAAEKGEEADESILNSNGADDHDDDDWYEDTGDDAVAKRMNELTSGINRLMANNDLEKSSEERLQIFFENLKKKIDENGNNNAFDVNAQKEIVGEAERLEVKDKAVLVLCELIFNENMIQQIKLYRNLFIRFCADKPKAQKYLLRGLEMTIKLYQNQLLPKVSHILKELYDGDILEEKQILEWAEKKNKKTVGKELAEQIHSKAAPFIKWLKEADEEDSSEEDEDDSDLDVVYDDRVIGDKIIQVTETPSKVNQQQKKDLENEDDLDIDAI